MAEKETDSWIITIGGEKDRKALLSIRDDKEEDPIDYHAFIYYVWFSGCIVYAGVGALLDLKSQNVEQFAGFFNEMYLVAFFPCLIIDLILFLINNFDLGGSISNSSDEKRMLFDLFHCFMIFLLSYVVAISLNSILMVVLFVIVVVHSFYTIMLIRKKVMCHYEYHRVIKENLFDSNFYNRLAMQMGSGLVGTLALVLNLVRKLRIEKQQPFEIESFFVNMSIVTLSVAALTSWIMVYINWCTRNSIKEIHYKILNIAFCFSMIVSPVSLLMSCVPANLKCIGHCAICVIFVIVVAYNFSGYMNENSTLEDQQVTS